MKTPDEIKKGLEKCLARWAATHYSDCRSDCPYWEEGVWCKNALHSNALTYINHLESRLAQVERERDAAVRIVHGLCLHCKNEDSKDDTCRECMYYPYRFVYGTGDAYVDNWQWRGVCEENTKEESH